MEQKENFYKKPSGAWEDFKHPDSIKHPIVLNMVLKEAGIKKQIIKDSTILDLGSGKGPFSKELLASGYENTLSLDINPRSNDRTLNEIKARIEQLPFRDETFDLIHSTMCFDNSVYNQDQRQMIKEMARVLKKSGVYFTFEKHLDPQEVESVTEGKLKPIKFSDDKKHAFVYIKK